MSQATDEQILRQQEAIRDQVNQTSPYVSEKADLQTLQNEFQGHSIFIEKTRALMKDFRWIRRVRGDGNCFFRGFGFALFEYLSTAPEAVVQKMVEKVQSSYAIMEKYYSTFVFEDYLEMFVEEMKTAKQHDAQYLFNFFQDFSNAESIVLFLRFLTSAQLRTESETFVHFLPPGFADVSQYCSSEVETMGRESEEIHIAALTTFLQINLRVAHLDQSQTDKPNFHEYTYSQDIKDPFFTMLYRPGHYDLIYP